MAYNPDEFVNRKHEVAEFRRVLDHPHQRIFLLFGPAGIGKTDVLQRCRRECRQPDMRSVLIDFRGDDGLLEPDQVIDRLRERMGGPFAERLGGIILETAQAFSSASLASLLSSLPQNSGGSVQISDARDLHIQGDVVGGIKVVLQNSSVVVNPTAGSGLQNRELITRLNTELPAALKAALAEQRLVLCFDHVDETSPPVQSWITHQVLRLLQDEPDDYVNLWIVVAGHDVPLRHEASMWRHLVHPQELKPLSEEDIRAFWIEKRHLPLEEVQEVIAICQGNPLELVRKANAEAED